MSEKRKFYQKKRIMIPVLIGLALIFLGIFGAFLSSLYLTTNNAYVLEYSTPLVSKVEGKIVKLNLENGSVVKKGEIVAQIDDSEILKNLSEEQEEFSQVQKNMDNLVKELENAAGQMQKEQDEFNKAKTDLENANDDYVRYKNEFKDGTVTQKDLDKAIKNLEVAQNNYEKMQANLKNAKETFKVALDKKNLYDEELNEAIEELQESKLEFSNTNLIATKNGTIANLNLKVNDEIDENQKLADIVLDECFVLANFKKLYKEDLKIGKKATVKVYTLCFKTFEGEVVEIMPEKSNLIPVKIKISNNAKKCNIKTNAKAFVKIKVK